jgi:hypothetical protein
MRPCRLAGISRAVGVLKYVKSTHAVAVPSEKTATAYLDGRGKL